MLDRLAQLRTAPEQPPALLGYDGDVSQLRRSSIAIILRVPGYSADSLDAYLAGIPSDPEILFIKRTVSPRDRWSGHIAVPGGRQDPGETDEQTAIRETFEEVGLDLTTDAWLLGPLDQRLLRVSWGRVVAMCLCPFVFVLNRWDAPLAPQVAEVATAFWYPMERLLNTQNETHEYVAAGNRISLPHWLPFQSILKFQAGTMQFPAIILEPTGIVEPPPPYKLWGVTLAVLQDIFYLINPESVQRIKPPTIVEPDMRLIVYILTWWHRYRRRNDIKKTLKTGSLDISNRLLEGYFWYMPVAIGTATILRAVVILGGAILLARRTR